MTQEPEQVLPEERIATAADMAQSVRLQTGWQEETGVGHLVHQLHDARGLQGREREQQQESSHANCAQNKNGRRITRSCPARATE